MVKQSMGASQAVSAANSLSSTVMRRAPRQAVVRIAIERVLADIEIEGGEIVDGEIEQRMEDTLEVVRRVALAHGVVQLGEAREHIALELGHLRVRHGEALLVVGEIAEQIAERVAELAVGLDIGLDDLGADAEVLGVVRAHGPEPQDLGARLADHVLRRHHIAERFRHLAPVLVDDEAVRHHRIIGRAAARAASLKQRGLEPAAMLVRAFEIELGRPFEVGALLQHERMGRA